MSLLHPAILFGLGLAAIPIVLHLVMRAKPKRIEFPALLLLHARKQSNARRMRVRHLLLLILRALLIAVAVIALTRPSLPPARYGLRTGEWILLLLVVAGTIGFYVWRNRHNQATIASNHELRARTSTLRAGTLIGGIAALLLIVGVPWGLRVRGELLSPRPELAENIPVSAIMIFDVSGSMTYRRENLTRIDHAANIAVEHLAELPAGSRAAVTTNSRDDDVVFQADLIGARSRIESLESQPATYPLNRVLKRAIEEQTIDRERVLEEGTTGGDDGYLREIYIFTDLSQTAWKEPDEEDLIGLLQAVPWLQVFIIDVSVEQPMNLSLTELQLSEESAVEGDTVFVNVTLTGYGDVPAIASAELSIEDEDGNLTRVGAPKLANPREQVAQLTFPIQAGSGPIVHGQVRMTGTDPLAMDDQRYFTFGVRRKPRVLLVGDKQAEVDYVQQMLAPAEAVRLGAALHECQFVSTNTFPGHSLDDTDVVILMNCRNPAESVWEHLHQFVRGGGKALVILGNRHILPSAWRTATTAELLPGLPVTDIRFLNETVTLDVSRTSHPILRILDEYDGLKGAFGALLFDKAWSVDVAESAEVVIPFNDRVRRPALLERAVGNGRCLMFTSAMDNLQGSGRDWNNLAALGGQMLVMLDQTVKYLTNASTQRMNFTSGSVVTLPVPASERFSSYFVWRPRLRKSRGDLALDAPSILLEDVHEAGHYTVSAADGADFRAGFSINPDDAESNLEVMTEEMLSDLIGDDRFAIVRSTADLNRAVQVGRIGFEVFPLLLILLVIFFAAEHLMANFFYDDEPESTTPVGRQASMSEAGS